MLNPFVSYDNAYEHDNVYGHAVELLCRFVKPGDGRGDRPIHVDIGCGFGRIAEPIRDRLGVTYIGIDAEDSGLKSLSERGFETHQVMLGDFAPTYEAIERACAGRPVASVTMLDTLEHLPNGEEVLKVISKLIAKDGAVFVLSVPNVTHRDICNKLASGRWDYTDVGLLDHTHTRLFSDTVLTRLLQYSGLHAIDTNDVKLATSDQHFPATHPALARGSNLREFFDLIRSDRERDARLVNQFVRACVHGPESSQEPFLSQRDLERPFLSVITRTQGTRLDSLAEVAVCLAGQTEQDFEWIVLGHRLTPERLKKVERLIEDSPSWLRERSRLVLVDHGNRTHPLNVGFQEAKGQYISVLDDDDICLAHWVETFRQLGTDRPGRLLRTVAARQDIERVEVLGRTGIRSTSSLERPYPSKFDLLEHLRENHTPPVSVAFPRGPFHDLGMKFDESLTTTEDWDYIMRVALMVGVADSPKITCIYHWWDQTNVSSRTEHDQDEWRQNHEWIYRKLDTRPILLPANTTKQIRRILDERDRLLRAIESGNSGHGASTVDLRRQLERARTELADLRKPQRQAALRQVLELLDSTSWRITAPLRGVKRLVTGSRAPTAADCIDLTTEQLSALSKAIVSSASWRLTEPVRRLKGLGASKSLPR